MTYINKLSHRKPYMVESGFDKDGKPIKRQVHFAVSLNRSANWTPAKTYAEARAPAPLPEIPIR